MENNSGKRKIEREQWQEEDSKWEDYETFLEYKNGRGSIGGPGKKQGR